MLIDVLGFLVPVEWIILVIVGIAVPTSLLFIVILFRGKQESPVEQNMALIQPIDEHDTLQIGTLIGNVQRTEDELIIMNPEWKDDDGNEYEGRVPIEKIIPLTFIESATRALKRLWVVVDKGDLSAVSASVITKGIPLKWDVPYVDRRKAGRFLVGRLSASSITNALTGTKTGIVLVVGLVMFGFFMGVTMLAASGHLK